MGAEAPYPPTPAATPQAPNVEAQALDEHRAEVWPATLQESGATRAIERIGDAWVLRVLRSVFRGRRRFGQMQAELGVSRAVLSDRLRRMVDDELLVLQRPSGGARGEYRLSEQGLDLWRTLLAMWQWERDWGTGPDPQAPAADRPRPRLMHLACGQWIDPICSCSRCSRQISPFETEALPRPQVLQQGTPPEGAANASPSGSTQVQPSRRRFRKSGGGRKGAVRQALPRLMRVFGDRWNCAILAAALQGASSFSDLQRRLAIGTRQLADRLAELQALQMLQLRSRGTQRPEYRLTKAAIATFWITLELMQWGERWLWHGTAPLGVRHKPCGAVLGTQWQCSHCQGVLERGSLRFESG